MTGVVDVDKNKQNTKYFSKMMSYTTFEAHFITKLRNTWTELNKCAAHKKEAYICKKRIGLKIY